MRPSLALKRVAVGILAAGSAWGAPITINTALPVGGGEFVARGMVVVSQSGEDPGATDRDHSTTSLVTVLGSA